jgi:hypothetical protein
LAAGLTLDAREARCYAFFAENREAAFADLIPWAFGPREESQKRTALNLAAEFGLRERAVETEQKLTKQTK